METPIDVVPGNGFTCIVGDATGDLCGPNGQVLAGQTFGVGVCGTVPEGEVAIYGLLPDGASAVTVQLADGRQVDAAPENNVVYRLVDVGGANDLPASVHWTDAAGQDHDVATPTPADAVGQACGPAPTEASVPG